MPKYIYTALAVFGHMLCGHRTSVKCHRSTKLVYLCNYQRCYYY